jgi:WD40 repeat protein
MDGEVISPSTAKGLQTANQVNEPGATAVEWLENSREFAVAGEGGISVYSTAAELQGETLETALPTHLASSPAGEKIAWAGQDGSVSLAAAGMAEPVILEEGLTAEVTGLAFSPDGEQVAASLFDQRILIWNAETGEDIAEWELPGWLSNITYSPDGAYIGGVDQQTFTVVILDAASGEVINILIWEDHASPVLYDAVFSPDWETVAWVARGTVLLMEVQTGEIGPTLGHEDFVNKIAWSPDGDLLASSAAGTNEEGAFVPLVTLWDPATGEPVSLLTLPEVAIDLSFSPDGTSLATLYSSGTVQLWRAAN